MRNYELIVILSSKIEEDKQKKLLAIITEFIEANKGKVKQVNQWGKKELTYPIKKQREGIYVQFEIAILEDKIPELANKIKAEDNILRHLFIRI